VVRIGIGVRWEGERGQADLSRVPVWSCVGWRHGERVGDRGGEAGQEDCGARSASVRVDRHDEVQEWTMAIAAVEGESL
jgi:hypothetical protein